MMRAWILVLAATFACKGREHHAPAAPPTAAGSGAVAAPRDAAATVDPAVRAFCIRSMHHIAKCFDDDAFWDAHATTFFAAQKQPIDPEQKKHWIGMYKDSYATLARGKELEHNCDVMLAENQLPTREDMDLVDAASAQSCAAFGGALGYVLFTRGAFYKPADGVLPPPELTAPSP